MGVTHQSDHSLISPGLWASRQIEPRRAPQAAAGNIQTKGLNSTTWLLHRFRININLLLLKFLTHWRFWTLKKKKTKKRKHNFLQKPALVLESVVNYLQGVRGCMLSIRRHRWATLPRGGQEGGAGGPHTKEWASEAKMQRSPKVTSTHRVSALFSALSWKIAALCACAPPTGLWWNNTSAGCRMGKGKDGRII